MDYLELVKEGNMAKIQEAFASQKPSFSIEPAEAISQYKVTEHDIFNESLRPKKTIVKDSGQRNVNDEPIMVTAQVDVARVGLPFQKIIVNRRVGFMLSSPVYNEPIYVTGGDGETQLVKLIERIQNDNKIDYKNKEIARRMMSELECAELWYFVENINPSLEIKFTLKMKIVSPALGDTLFPAFDETGDLVAFARAYKLKEKGKDIEHYDIYLPDALYKFVKRGEWKLDDQLETPNPIPNPVGKIMVIYYSQPEPEWADVQSMITRLETIISNHADTNDYFGSPILTVIGEIQGYAQKGETGKILQLTKDSQANYLALASEPASIKMEEDTLERYIYAMSQTPDITFEQMKGLGNLSGVALKLMFMDAHMAVKNKEEVFGIGLQRRLNLLKACIGKVINTALAKEADTVQIKPVLTPYLPENVTEEIDNLINALNGNIISQETAVEQNPLIGDSKTEKDRIKEDSLSDVAGMRTKDKSQVVIPPETI